MNEYAERAREFMNQASNTMLMYLALGLNGEAGEVAEKIKRILRTGRSGRVGELTTDEREALILEVGDVLWYVTMLAETLGFGLEQVASMNVEKLSNRRKRGVIFGEGDNR